MAQWIWRSGAIGFVEADGARLEAQSFGPPPDSAPTLVLLHEGLGCVALWRDFPSRLAEATGFGVFVYSRAGYGRSDPTTLPRPLDYMSREARDVLPRVLDEIGWRRGVLLGHSDGATIAAIYAGGVADFRLRGLVLMAPHFFAEPSGLGSIAEAQRAYAQSDLRARLAKYHDHVDVAFRGWSEAWLDPAFRDWNVADCLDDLRVPTLAIQGREDQYGTVAQIDELSRRSCAPVDAKLFDGCRHSPHLERPAETLAAIADFCARIERDAASTAS